MDDIIEVAIKKFFLSLIFPYFFFLLSLHRARYLAVCEKTTNKKESGRLLVSFLLKPFEPRLAFFLLIVLCVTLIVPLIRTDEISNNLVNI